MTRRLPIAAQCVLAGTLLWLSLPPWGWWPLSFGGIVLLDDLIAEQPWRTRAKRTWLVCVAWLAPGMIWMWDLTPPGYLLASVTYAGYFALGAAVAPGDRRRLFALPAAFALAEMARWSFPFGGVPLATIPQMHASTPWAVVVRLGGPLLLVAVVVAAGQSMRSALVGARRMATIGAAFALVAFAAATVAPRASATGTVRVAAVQGGGPQRTRAADTDERVVFERHLAASEQITTPVDLVLWPENVVNLDSLLEESVEHEELGALAKRLDATLIAGVVEVISDTNFLNAAVAYGPDGAIVDRFDKVRIVPFGEWVPLRGLIERLNSAVPARDVLAGSGPGVLDTPAGRFGVVISWEAFFANRGRSGIEVGGEVLLNPTNGSSYWLTVVQSQQVASLQLRALETDRWVVEAAPTGFTSIVSPDGEVLERTDITKRAVIQTVVERRSGETPYVRYGDWPLLGLALLSLLVVRAPDLRRRLARS